MRTLTRQQTAQEITAPPVVTYAHAARVLGVSRSRASQLAAAGELSTARLHGRVYVTKSSLDRLLATRSAKRST